MSGRRNIHPLAKSPFLEYPLETHVFEVDPKDDYRCRRCRRPRALHADLETLLSPDERREPVAKAATG